MDDQATFDFPAAEAVVVCDRTGFQIGWDHAHHGLVPAPELLLGGTPVGQGWRAGRAVFGSRTQAAPRPVRQWLQLRSRAWRGGIAFDVTAKELAEIESPRCPVTRQPFGGSGDDAPRIVRLRDDAGYAAGNLALVSRRAAAVARRAGSVREALRAAARIDAGIDTAPDGQTPAETWRLAVLRSFVTPLPFVESVRVPLRVLPPSRVRPVNAAQRLQALLTLQFATPGWSARLRRVADLLPAGARHDFQLLVGALAPRVLEAGAHDTRRALEDAWADERLNRRWQTFAHVLGEAGVDALLQRVVASADDAGRASAARPAAAVRPAGGRRVTAQSAAAAPHA